MLKLKQIFYRWKYSKKQPEMVKYWKTGDAVEAKVMRMLEGHYVMYMKGEDYLFPSYPRGTLLFGPLSPLKHVIKNRLFNTTWKHLEEGVSQEDIQKDVRAGFDEVFALAEKGKFDMVPYEAMNPNIKELWRAMTVVEKKTNSYRVKKLKEILCFILQEDDAYRFRFQWMVKFFNPNSWWRKLLRRDPIKDFDLALSMLEHGEVIGDMKERQRLFRRGLMTALKDPSIRQCFLLLCKELDWKKLELSKADKYFFRAKYFKVDWPELEY